MEEAFVSSKQNRPVQRDLASGDFLMDSREKEANSLEDQPFQGVQVK
jgi:hypothetical protein